MNYDRRVIAYHGCDAKMAKALLEGEPFQPSDNDYDWLGSGIYFWEFGADRAMRFARGKTKRPAVVGAIIQLGRCFDLMDTRFTAMMATAFEAFNGSFPPGTPLPTNAGKTPDKKLRRLDCAVLNFYLRAVERERMTYDSVRCAFVEGESVFDGSGIHRETHVQIAVRNPACILGVFRPMMQR